MLNVWGSWCAPCVAEAPALQKTWRDLQADKARVEFMGIDFREDPARGAAFAKKAGITYPSLTRRVRGRHPGPAGQGTRPCPTTLVLDTEGRIAARVNGPATASTLRGLVDDVVAAVVTAAAGTAAVLAAGDTVTSGALPLAVAVAAFAGLVSFASPCVLPLVPGLPRLRDRPDRRAARREVAQPGGDRGAALRRRASPWSSCSARSSSPRPAGPSSSTACCSCAWAGWSSSLMGLVFLGIGRQREARIGWRPRAGARPVRPVLGARVRARLGPVHRPDPGGRARPGAAPSVDPQVGGASCSPWPTGSGLGLPFILIAAGLDRAGRASGWLRRHQRTIQRVGGVMLVLVGLLMVTGLWQSLNTWLQSELVNGFQVSV